MIPNIMILTGSLTILALAGYWFIRAELAERRASEAQARLSSIILQDTPGGNATVKRIIRIARGEA